jgi:hypothetical protein
VTRLQAGRPKRWFSILGRGRSFSLLQCPYRLCAHCFFYPVGTTDSFAGNKAIQWVPGIKRPRREADHSPLSSDEVKYAWNYTSISPSVFMAWCLIKYRDYFTFTIPNTFQKVLRQYSFSSYRRGQFSHLFIIKRRGNRVFFISPFRVKKRGYAIC